MRVREPRAMVEYEFPCTRDDIRDHSLHPPTTRASTDSRAGIIAALGISSALPSYRVRSRHDRDSCFYPAITFARLERWEHVIGPQKAPRRGKRGVVLIDPERSRRYWPAIAECRRHVISMWGARFNMRDAERDREREREREREISAAASEQITEMNLRADKYIECLARKRCEGGEKKGKEKIRRVDLHSWHSSRGSSRVAARVRNREAHWRQFS